MAGAGSFGDLTAAAGLKKLDEHLSTRSFVAGGTSATAEDFEVAKEVGGDMLSHKHVARWHKHIRVLQSRFPLKRWARAGAPSAGGGGGGAKDQARLEGLLPNAEHGKVCTRFPPEPSGYLHIGHVKAVMLNNHYARHYGGKLIVRFDDTNPSKEKQEFHESIIHDLASLGIKPDVVSCTSDHFEYLQDQMERLIKKGSAYVDDTDVETMRQERDKGTESARRNQSGEENMRLWKEMLKGSEEGLKCCVRGRMDMQNLNKCLRDPVFYRCKTEVPHHRTKDKYKAYPTYDFACPLVDSHEGVSHALRTIEYKDRDEMYKWVQEKCDVRRTELVEFSKMQFAYTVLSKRKLKWFADNGLVEGWFDPRFPTVQGVLRRGMTVEALREFVMTQGMSKATNLMEWDKIWAMNRAVIDPVVPRFSSVIKEGAAPLKLSGIKGVECVMDKKHPKNPDLGERMIMRAPDVFLEQEDAAAIEKGEEVTLLHWGNAIIEDKQLKGDRVVAMSGRLNPGGDVKKTKKVHWLPNLPDHITPITLRELDHLVTKDKIEEDDKIEDIVNPCSLIDTPALGDPMLKTMQKGDTLQLERRGFFIIDVAAFPPDQPMVLIKIPEGKTKDMGMKSNVDPKKLVGKADGKEPAKGAAPAEQAKASKKEAPKAPEEAKKKGKEAGGGGAKPAAAGDRALDDVSRLNIIVGRIQKVWPHPDADKLYCEEIDLGEPSGPRSIASGLRKHLKEEDMKDQLVCVLANLKFRKMQGFESQGMVMCATDAATGAIEILSPPKGAKVGERVSVEGVEMLDPDEKLNEKTGKAPFPVIQPEFSMNSSRQATWKGQVWTTSAGPVTAKTVTKGSIS